MNRAQLAQLLKNIATGKVTPEAGLEQLRFLPYEDVGFARIDHHRSLRQGVPEVIYGEGKTVDQVRIIGERILHHGSDLLATRLSPQAAEALLALAPQAEYNAIARTVVVRQAAQHTSTTGVVLVAAAGTSDLPVAEEAAVTASALGSTVQTLYDVGVAGLHRLLDQYALLAAARARIYEVPISYSGRDYSEGKKIGWRDGIQALSCIVKCRLLRNPRRVWHRRSRFH